MAQGREPKLFFPVALHFGAFDPPCFTWFDARLGLPPLFFFLLFLVIDSYMRLPRLEPTSGALPVLALVCRSCAEMS